MQQNLDGINAIHLELELTTQLGDPMDSSGLG